MARQSRMMELGRAAPAFALPDASGRVHSLGDFTSSQALLVAFICNHCPFVKHLIGPFAALAREYQPRGLATVAISSNDVASHPEDSPARMGELARRLNFSFPYLYDESQSVALAYEAVCTPDFFLFDQHRQLAYRGRFDDTRPGGSAPTGADLRAAVESVLAGKVPEVQRASTGCSIKWKPANEPAWS
jgi:peroxiredoxin